MSSHHVIRDDQEPPIFVLNENFDIDVLNELLGWAPLLYVEASLYKWFQARNVKVDGVIILNDTDDTDYERVTKYYLSTLKDSLLELVMQVINNKPFTAFNLFCNEDQGREVVKESRIGPEKYLPFTLFIGGKKTIVTFKNKFAKWFPAGQRIIVDRNRVAISPKVELNGDCYEVKEEGTYIITTEELPLVIEEF